MRSDTAQVRAVWTPGPHRPFRVRPPVSAALVAALLVAACAGEGAEPTATDPTPVEAPVSLDDLLAEAQQQLDSRIGRNLLASIPQFERATELAPERAEGWAGLAEASALAGLYGLLPPAETMPRAEAAASRALELAPDAASSHAVLGLVRYLWHWQFDDAESSFARAVEFDAGNVDAQLWWAMMLSALGRHDAAVERAEGARAAADGARLVESKAATVLIAARRFDEARSVLQQTISDHYDYELPRRELGYLELAEGNFDAALLAFQEGAALGSPTSKSRVAYAHVLGLQGREQEAREQLDAIDQASKDGVAPPLSRALVLLGVGDHEGALAEVERAVERRDPAAVYLATRIGLSGLRGNDRFDRQLERIGLIDAPGAR